MEPHSADIKDETQHSKKLQKSIFGLECSLTSSSSSNPVKFAKNAKEKKEKHLSS